MINLCKQPFVFLTLYYHTTYHVEIYIVNLCKKYKIGIIILILQVKKLSFSKD